MEKIPAACAMDWSIDLEVGLRCGQAMEVLEKIGPQLRKLSQDSLTAGITQMYGLVRGEGRTFANTIILRLADAFKIGDSRIRSQIIHVFLQELRHIMKLGRNYNGILARQRIFDHLELLKRIKSVYDTGDIEARALSLYVLGCWCDLTKDCADVRHMILSSLQSVHAREVKGSLFAAGCICRLSEDFACIMLGSLVNIIGSKAPSTVKVSAALALGKMQCSFAIINRAYKVGRQLVLDLPFDKITAALLFSLTKLATVSFALISEQLELLFSLLDDGPAVSNGIVLKCALFLLSKGGNHFPVSGSSLTGLFHVLDDPHLQVDLKSGALHLLQKIASARNDLPYLDIYEFLKLMSVIENRSGTSSSQKGCLALRFLVDALCNLKKVSSSYCATVCSSTMLNTQAPMPVFDDNGLLELASQASILAIDKVAFLVMRTNTSTGKLSCDSLDVKGNGAGCKILFSCVLKLLEEYHQLFPRILTRINSFIGDLISRFCTADKNTMGQRHYDLIGEASDAFGDVHGKELGIKIPRMLPDSALTNEECYSRLVSEVVSCSCRFIVSCLRACHKSSSVTIEVFDTVRHFAEYAKNANFYYTIQFEIFHLELVASIMQHEFKIRTFEEFSSRKHELHSSSYLHCIQHEYLALQFSKKIFSEKNNWALYRAGKFFACEGLWLAATFSFRKLVDCMQSESCTLWLRSLMLLAAGESEAKLLLFPNVSVTLISWLRADYSCQEPWNDVSQQINETSNEDVNLHDYGGNLTRIYEKIYSSKEALSAVKSTGDIFYFQRWFLDLRGRIFEVVENIDSLLLFCEEKNTVADQKQDENICSTEMLKKKWHILGTRLSFISCQLNKLSKEFDILSTSILNIDNKSSSAIGELALGCSLLAFSAAIPFFFQEQSVFQQFMDSTISFLDRSACSMLLQDLVERLWDIDSDSVSNLLNCFTVSPEFGVYKQSLIHLSASNLTEDIARLCRLSILMICNLCEDFKEAQGNKIINQVYEGTKIFHKIVEEWVKLPFKIPKCFFKTRPCTSIELFIFNANPRSSSRISAVPGMQLSLNLCVQLKNASVPSTPKITKVHCLLASSLSHCLLDHRTSEDGSRTTGHQLLESGLLIAMNEKLLALMKDDDEVSAKNQNLGTDRNDWVLTCLRFELSETGQGFSTCLLDVSSFPEGVYQMYWHSCCVGNNGSLWTLPCVNSHFFSIHNSYV